ncbi:short-chain dehydrogenase, partial [Streptomyces sp. SID11233]|nr:short-chain dehydrogenase [Streptomyces sp. SID11233]
MSEQRDTPPGADTPPPVTDTPVCRRLVGRTA